MTVKYDNMNMLNRTFVCSIENLDFTGYLR